MKRDYSAEYAARVERAKDAGYASYWDQRQDRKSESYKRHFEAAKQASKDAGIKFDRKEFESRRLKALGTKSNLPNGRKSKFLVDIGLRDPNADYAVGQTPKQKDSGMIGMVTEED